jgi:hypothetical protein
VVTIALLLRAGALKVLGFKHYYINLNNGIITKVGLREQVFFYTILLILETILLQAFGSEGEDYLDIEGSSNNGRRIFHGIQ